MKLSESFNTYKPRGEWVELEFMAAAVTLYPVTALKQDRYRYEHYREAWDSNRRAAKECSLGRKSGVSQKNRNWPRPDEAISPALQHTWLDG